MNINVHKLPNQQPKFHVYCLHQCVVFSPWVELRSENEINAIAYPKKIQMKNFTSCKCEHNKKKKNTPTSKAFEMISKK
jgi:hypothetical protein